MKMMSSRIEGVVERCSRKECGTKEQDEQEGFLEKVLPILEIVGMVAHYFVMLFS